MIDKAELLREARVDLAGGRYDHAQAKYEDLLHADAADVDGRLGLARVALAKGRFAEARGHAERVLGDRPRLLDADILRLLAVEAEGDRATALAEMSKLAEAHPSSCLALYHVGRLLAAGGDAERAIGWLERAEAQADRARHRYEIRNLIGYVEQDRGRTAAALAAHQHAIEISPKRTQAYVGLADAMARGGDPDAGLTMLDEAEKRIGEHAELLRKRADLLAGKGDLHGALAAAQRLCERQPDDAGGWLSVAQLSLELRAFEQAEQAARRARNAAPDDWQPHFTLGLAYDAQDDLARAEAAYREALRRQPTSWQPANNLGLTLLARGEPDAVAEAEQLFAQAAKQAGGKTLQPSFNHALALARLGERSRFAKLKGQLLGAGLPPAARERLAAAEHELGTGT